MDSVTLSFSTDHVFARRAMMNRNPIAIWPWPSVAVWREPATRLTLSAQWSSCNHVILNRWDNFPEIEIIALMEPNRLIHRAQQKGISIPTAIDGRLIRLLDLDVRTSMSWDADLPDVDLHVFEPTGEPAYYGHNRSSPTTRRVLCPDAGTLLTPRRTSRSNPYTAPPPPVIGPRRCSDRDRRGVLRPPA
jgi:hypothetical protein